MSDARLGQQKLTTREQNQGESFQSSNLDAPSDQAEHWRSLAYAMPPSNAPRWAAPQGKDTSQDAQWLRKLSLTAYDKDTGTAIELSSLRVNFNVKHTTVNTPDILWCRVYNMAPKTMAKVIEFKRVMLKGGYRFAGYGTLFDGLVVQYRRGKENPTDTYLEIHAADGDKLINRGHFSATFPEGTSDLDIIKACAKEMQVKIKEIEEGIGNEKMQRDATYSQPGKEVLREVLAKYDARFFIENGEMVIIKNGSTRKGTAVYLSPKTGLVGLPEVTPQGIQAKCLLNPNIRPGGVIEIDTDVLSGVPFLPGSKIKTNSNGSTQGTQGTGGSDFPSPTGGKTSSIALWGEQLETAFTSPVGRYKVILLEQTGDTRGDPWFCDMVCVALDAEGGTLTDGNPSTVLARSGTVAASTGPKKPKPLPIPPLPQEVPSIDPAHPAPTLMRTPYSRRPYVGRVRYA